MNNLKRLFARVLITTLTLQPMLAGATEYRIPLKGSTAPNGTPQGGGGGVGDGSVEVGDGPGAATLVFAPKKLSFNVSRADDTLRTSLLTNEGNAPVTLKGFVSNSVFSIHHDCPVQLVPGDSCLVSATRAAGASPGASYSMAVRAMETAKASVLRLETTANGIEEGMPSLVLSQDMVDMGEVAPGVATAASTVLTNEGKGPANLRGIASNDEFNVTSNCPSDLAPGDSCTISATFASTISGTRSVTLTLSTSTGDLGIPLTFFAKVIGGTNATPALAFDQKSLTFAAMPSGMSATKQVHLYNPGTAPAPFSLSSLEGFAVQSDCPSTLPASKQCTVSITFTSSGETTAASGLLVASLVGGDEKTAAKLFVQSLRTSADTGQEQHGPHLQYTPDTVDFGTNLVGKSVAQQATLTNTGDEPAAIRNIRIDQGAGDFSQTNNCPSTLVPGASCVLSITHVPGGQNLRVGRVTAIFGEEQEASMALIGYGIQAILGASPAAISYGGVPLTAQLATVPLALSNSGNIPLTGVSVINRDPRLAVNKGNCTDSIASLRSCTLLVAYSPVSDGPFATTFQVESANGGTITVPVTGTAFRLFTSPSTLSFPTTLVGVSAPDQSSTLTNEGQVAVSLDGITLAFGKSSFNQSNNCGTSLAPGASCTITARFTPEDGKPLYGGVVVAVAGSLAAQVALEGTGVQPKLSLSSKSLNFPSMNVGRTSEPLSVIVSNMTDYSADITGISVVENTAEFAQSNNCDSRLTPGESCTISVQWSPKTKTASFGSMALVSSMGTETISLGGLPTQPVVIIKEPGGPDNTETPHTPDPDVPILITFPDTQVTMSSGVRNITFTNSGDGPLAVQGISVVTGASDFAQSNNCGAAIPANSSCVISMRFTPAAAGKRTGTLYIASETGNYQFNLSGSGIGAIGQLYEESSPDFGEVLVGNRVQRSFTFRNDGTVPAQNVKASVSGAGLSLVSNTCGTENSSQTIQPDASCSMVVEFAPVAAGELAGQLAVDSNAANGTQTLGLSGKAIHAVGQLTADSSTSFGTVSTGSTSSLKFTFLNKGDAPATGVYAKLEGTDMRISANSCGTEENRISLGVDKICSMTVSFAPTVHGQMSGTLTVYSSATNGAQSLELSGGAKFSTNGYALQFNGAHGSTTLVDVGTGAKWTSFNGASITTSRFKEGTGALNFNGANQAVSGPTIAYTGDFVFSGWIRQTARPSNFTTIVAQWDQSGGSDTGGWALSMDSAGRLLVSWAPATIMSAFMSSTASVPLNKWTHVALAREGSSLKVYMDGVVVASGTNAGQLQALNVPTSLGSYFNFSRVLGAGEFFTGQMDDVRIVTGSAAFEYNSQRSTVSANSTDFGSTEVADRATKQIVVTNSGGYPTSVESVTASGDFVVTDASACTSRTMASGASCTVTVDFQPSALGTRTGSLTGTSDSASDLTIQLSGLGVPSNVLKITAESGVTDAGGARLTNSGPVTVTANDPVDGTGSLLFAGQGSYLMTPSSSKYSLGTGDFTMEAWVRPATHQQSVIMSNYPNSSWTKNNWVLTTAHPATGNYAAFFAYNGSPSAPLLKSRAPLPLNNWTWTHLAITRQGTTLRLYVNGVLDASATFAGSLDGGISVPNVVGIGRMESGNGGWGFSGQMDDVRIIGGQAVYSGNFTPPTNMR